MNALLSEQLAAASEALALLGEPLSAPAAILPLYGAAGIAWLLASMTLALLLLIAAAGHGEQPFRRWLLWGGTLALALAATSGLFLAQLWLPVHGWAAAAASVTGLLLLVSATLLGRRLGAIARYPDVRVLQQRTVEMQRERDRLRQKVAELQKEQHKLTRLFEQLPTSAALVAPDGRWLKVNSQLQVLLGYTDQDLENGYLQSAIHSDDLQSLLDAMQTLLAGDGERFQQEIRYLRKDGSIHWALVSATLVFKPDGKPLHFLYQIQDITANKQTERDLASATERLRRDLAKKLKRMRTLESDLSRERQQRLHSERLIERSAKRLSRLNQRIAAESGQDASLS